MSSMAVLSLRITYCCSSLSPMNVNSSGVCVVGRRRCVSFVLVVSVVCLVGVLVGIARVLVAK